MVTRPTPLQRIAFLAALALAGSIASAASWVVNHKLTTKEGGDFVTVGTHRDGGIVLTVEDHPNVIPAPRTVVVFLSAHEALKLAEIIVKAIPPDALKSFDELAEESARKTDAEFCRKAVTEWERKAFCAGAK